MSIIIKADHYGSSGNCEYSLSRALSDSERSQCQAIANEQGAYCEIYSFPSEVIDDNLTAAEGAIMLHFIDPHPLIIPEIEALLKSLS
jgi:hypothetical protein